MKQCTIRDLKKRLNTINQIQKDKKELHWIRQNRIEQAKAKSDQMIYG